MSKNLCTDCKNLIIAGVIVTNSAEAPFCKEPLPLQRPNTKCFYRQVCMNNISVRECPQYQKSNHYEYVLF
jgi:hypothetical protein